jgi:hypothetical protein
MHAEHAQHPTNSFSNPNPKKKKNTILLFLLFNKILEPIDGGHHLILSTSASLAKTLTKMEIPENGRIARRLQ